ncbi:MAG TPA: hypothetical protein DEP25_01005, partial [Candidatus Taylorbacteria bacterium]|nr:hypothetical protein [Candidatus Taylorbacteria bacterium]
EQGSATTLGFYLSGYANATVDLFRISTSTLTATSTAIIVDSTGSMGFSTTSPFRGRIAVVTGSDNGGGVVVSSSDNTAWRDINMDGSGSLHFYGGDAGTLNNPIITAAGAFTDAPSFSFLKQDRSVLSRDELFEILDDTNIEKYRIKSEVAALGESADTHIGIILDEAHPLLSDRDENGDIIGYSPIRTAAAAFRGVQLLSGAIDIRNATTSFASIFIDSEGRVGIGTTSPSYKLQVAGDVAAESFVNISTRGAKRDIEYVAEGEGATVVERLRGLGVARYRYNDEAADAPLRLGLIAEESPLEVLSADGKGVDLYKLATFTLLGVKELDKRLAAVEVRLADLEARVGSSAQRQIYSSPTAVNDGSRTAVSAVNVVIDWLASLGVRLSAAVAEFRNVIASALTVGSADQPSGITLYDEVTKEPYCFKMSGGAATTTPGACTGSQASSAQSQADSNNPNSNGGNGNNTSPLTPPSTKEGVGTGADTTAPTITINGNNPAEIEVRSSYADLGAIVTDNVDTNLGVLTFLDGAFVSEIQINTAIAATYVVEYVAKDNAGNSATSTRTVIVRDPYATASPQTAADLTQTNADNTATTTPASGLPSSDEEGAGGDVDLTTPAPPAPAETSAASESVPSLPPDTATTTSSI